jgi:hypothetical protein
MACSPWNEKATGLTFSSGGCGLHIPWNHTALGPLVEQNTTMNRARCQIVWPGPSVRQECAAGAELRLVGPILVASHPGEQSILPAEQSHFGGQDSGQR